ncbi:MAG: outer membrane beta-barrel protein [Mucilaginibacter sp.]
MVPLYHCFNAKDSSLVKINLTEKDGGLLFDNIKSGSYLLSISAVGYGKTLSPTFSVDQGSKQVTVPDIKIEKKVNELNEVTVNEKKPFMERQLDRIVVNVNNSIVSVGSTALDVLARSPGVLVSQSDNISMKGKQGVTVMIDGKPTYLAATDLANLLRATPANSIDKIELITNPSAKFDASGSAGIINIKLKKDQRYGLNGTLSLSAGQGVYAKLNDGINLNYRNKNINIFGSYNYSYRENFNHLELTRNFYKPDGVTLDGAYKQDNYLTFPLHSHLVKAGMDYTPSKNTTIGFSLTGLLADFNPGCENASDVLDSLRQKTSSFHTSNTSKNKPKNYAANVNFKHTIDTTGQEITTDLDYARYSSNSLQNYITSYFNNDGSQSQPNDILRDNQIGALSIYSIKTDYLLPLKGDAKFEAGFKSSYVTADNNLSFYNIINDAPQFDTTKSNHFLYKENINALYVNYNKNYKKFKYQLGLRAEQTISNGNQLTTNNKFRNSYIQVFPSIFLSEKLNDKNEISLSVGRRIDRPTYRQLNPFKFFLDPSTYVEGNPYLKPQLTYQTDFTYTFLQKYSLTLSYSNTSDNITSVLIPNDADAG